MQPKDHNQTEAIPFKKKPEESTHDYSFWEMSESHEEKIEVDERWLVTYADKMTLLSGCFLMLFAMSTLDPERVKKLKVEAQKSFEKQAAPLETKENSANELKTELETKNKELETLTQKLQQEKSQLEQALANLKAQTSQPSQQTEMNQLTTENESLKSSLRELKKTLLQQKTRIEDLTATAPSSNFLAFVMSWGTRDQDVDLIVTDPKGHVFNFKTRNYENSPGLLVLDTRQGPGVEIWQSDRIIPGTYTFTFQFYSSYGNNEPCPVTGSLFTPKGKISFPQTILNPEKRQKVFKVEITPEGKATLQS